MKRIHDNLTGDLFAATAAAAAAQPNGAPATDAATDAAPSLDSPFVADTATWLSEKTKAFGSVLASDRAADYVAVLRAFADFRRHHEPEPLHEDVCRAVCGADADRDAEQTFKALIRQLETWGLVTERIEKERLRGYRDTRRTKFRYRMCDEAANFVEWLSERREQELSPTSIDVTGNLLDLQLSLLHELRRRLREIKPAHVETSAASDVVYRVVQTQNYVKATAKTLQELNVRLSSFGTSAFSLDEAKPVIDELALFLDRFGRRFGELRAGIELDLGELRRPTLAPRWAACLESVRAEAAKFQHIATGRLPDVAAILEDAARFYGADGTLVELMQRIVDSARRVWGKLNAKLRELERRNHRLEDLGARLRDLAALGEDDVPHAWLRELLQTATMRGDPQIRPSGEKSRHPLPKASAHVRAKKIVTWITPRTVGAKPDVQSIAQRRAEQLKEWMQTRGIYPAANAATKISALRPQEFADFSRVMTLLQFVRLGEGEKARRHLGVAGEPNGDIAHVASPGLDLQFEDLRLHT